MAGVLTASNSSLLENKWVPYYFKPFQLGGIAGVGSTDGNTYITHDNQAGTTVLIEGSCDNSHNCGYYYKIIMDDVSSNTYFYVEKWTNGHELVEKIYASETGDSDTGKWWKMSTTYGSVVTIDIGVTVYFPASTSWADEDEYWITLPSKDTMDRRKIYHGGYSTYMRMPYAEGVAFHSDIIPTSLKEKNVTALLSYHLGFQTHVSQNKGHHLLFSKEDITGNRAVSMSLEWNVDKDSATSAVAESMITDAGGNNIYGWSANETWQLGSIFIDDVDPSANIPTNPAHGHSSSTDVTPVSISGDDRETGASQPLNVSVSGRAGNARMKLEFAFGIGTSPITAHNQFWPIILLIS